MKDNNKEADSNTSINNDIDTSNIEYDIHYVLENVAALGRDAYGAYNERMKEYLVLTIRKAVMEERIRAMQSERTSTIDSIISRFEQAGTQIDSETALHVLREMK